MITGCRLVSTFEQPELAAVSARWRWEAFFRESGRPLDDVLTAAAKTASAQVVMPQTLVLLENGVPIGTASLVAHDLDERPELSPWLAGVFVVPEARGQGHVAKLVAAIEARAAAAGFSTLWLYTNRAERVYARLGWITVERLEHGGKAFAVMRRGVGPCR